MKSETVGVIVLGHESRNVTYNGVRRVTAATAEIPVSTSPNSSRAFSSSSSDWHVGQRKRSRDNRFMNTLSVMDQSSCVMRSMSLEPRLLASVSSWGAVSESGWNVEPLPAHGSQERPSSRCPSRTRRALTWIAQPRQRLQRHTAKRDLGLTITPGRTRPARSSANLHATEMSPLAHGSLGPTELSASHRPGRDKTGVPTSAVSKGRSRGVPRQPAQASADSPSTATACQRPWPPGGYWGSFRKRTQTHSRSRDHRPSATVGRNIPRERHFSLQTECSDTPSNLVGIGCI